MLFNKEKSFFKLEQLLTFKMLIAIDFVRCYNNVMKFYCSKKDLIIGRYAVLIVMSI